MAKQLAQSTITDPAKETNKDVVVKRKAYIPPKLTLVGSVDTLTLGGSNPVTADSGSVFGTGPFI